MVAVGRGYGWGFWVPNVLECPTLVWVCLKGSRLTCKWSHVSMTKLIFDPLYVDCKKHEKHVEKHGIDKLVKRGTLNSRLWPGCPLSTSLSLFTKWRNEKSAGES